MAFTCKKCLPESQKWLAELGMGVSYGRCESCGRSAGCVDYHGGFEDVQESCNEPPVDEYDKEF